MIYRSLYDNYTSPITSEAIFHSEIRPVRTGKKLVEALSKCAFVKETGADLGKVLAYLQRQLSGDKKYQPFQRKK